MHPTKTPRQTTATRTCYTREVAEYAVRFRRRGSIDSADLSLAQHATSQAQHLQSRPGKHYLSLAEPHHPSRARCRDNEHTPALQSRTDRAQSTGRRAGHACWKVRRRRDSGGRGSIDSTAISKSQLLEGGEGRESHLRPVESEEECRSTQPAELPHVHGR